MTGSRPDPDLPQPDDLDPTGVRSLLANLPDPGPMPDELVARITQSLELEQQRRSAGGPSGYPGGPAGTDRAADLSTGSPHDPSLVSLDAERQRRRPGRTVLWLGGAAAVAMVATLSVNQLIPGDSDAGVSAQVPAADSADAGSDAGTDDAAAGRDEASDLGAIPNHPAAEAPLPSDLPTDEAADGAGEVDAEAGAGDAGTASLSVFSADGTLALSPGAWGDQVSRWVSDDPDRGTSSWSSRDALECVTQHDLDVAAARQLLLSDATWDATPAVLLVTQEAQGDTAWVVTVDCAEVLSGPLTLPR